MKLRKIIAFPFLIAGMICSIIATKIYGNQEELAEDANRFMLFITGHNH